MGEKNAFYKFLDESYFAFWFRQWSAVFIIIGVILVIVGAVVSQVLPPQQYATFAQSQIVTSTTSSNYKNWATKDEQVRFDFLSVDPSTLATTMMGPYFYARALSKSNIIFGSDYVTYTLTTVKTFVVTGSAPATDLITLANPAYGAMIVSPKHNNRKDQRNIRSKKARTRWGVARPAIIP